MKKCTQSECPDYCSMTIDDISTTRYGKEKKILMKLNSNNSNVILHYCTNTGLGKKVAWLVNKEWISSEDLVKLYDD